MLTVCADRSSSIILHLFDSLLTTLIKFQFKIMPRLSRMCHPIIGYDKELVFDRMLPTILDVLRYYNFLVTKGKLESNRFPPFDDVARVVVQKVESIWSKASIPTTTSRNITRKLQYEVEKLKNIAKSFHRDFAREKFGIRKSQYLARTDNLFDICSCQCQEVTKCSCPKEKKIPKL